MHRRCFILLAVLLAALALSSTAATDGHAAKARTSGSRSSLVPGRALVEFRAGVSTASLRAAATRAEARILREVTRCWVKDGAKLVVVHSATQTTAQLVEAFSADPRVAYAEPDSIVHLDATPNDPRFGELWGMTKISAPSAWDVSTGSSSVVIADIDSGVDYTHPDLAANMWHNPLDPIDGIDNDGNGYIDDYYGINAITGPAPAPGALTDPMDDDGHGTHTSGIMAAVGNNSIGVAGVCWAARIMALKFVAADGDGFTSDAIACINYVVDQKVNHNVNVVAMNSSWGSQNYEQSLKDAITAAGNAGIVFVASAGNGDAFGTGLDTDAWPHYPASYDCANIIAVAASGSSDALIEMSNYGVVSVDLAAPGVNILSTVPSFVDAGRYKSWEGTSMAAPHVTGAVALCAAKYPTETMAERIERILRYVDAVPALAGKCVTGGRLNVSTAIGGALPTDAQIPGFALPPSPLTGSLSAASDRDDVYRVYLKAEATIQATISGAAGSNLDLHLFAPGATTVADKGAAVAHAQAATYPDTLTYVVPTAGMYYLDAYATSGSGSYTLTYTVARPPDDDIPGPPIPASPVTGTVSATTDWDDVFAIHLGKGQVITGTIGSAVGVDCDLYLFAPDATSVFVDTPVAYWGLSGPPPNSFSYWAPAPGTYYFAVFAYSGAGAYTLTYSVAPAIESFSPTTGAVGGTVTLTGSGFTGATAVTFNGVAATTFSVVTDHEMTVTVPSGATTGGIAVTTPGGIGRSTTSFTVVPGPTITGFSPTSGPVGTTVVVSGTMLSGIVSVTFNGVVATSFFAYNGQVTVTVPAGATSGPIAVTTYVGTATSAASFTVTGSPPAPRLTSFTPASGPEGASVVLTGSGLSGATAVTFNGVAASFSVDSDEQITSTVPSGATSGPLAVTTPAGVATTGQSFIVVPAPRVTRLTPSAARRGATVTISGTGFAAVRGVGAVQFGAKACTRYVSWSATKIKCKVPAAAKYGALRVTVTTAAGVSNAKSFTVKR
jgi:subtilisin family serine protease